MTLIGARGRVGIKPQSGWTAHDYPHVAAAYWVFYRLARNHQGLVSITLGIGIWGRHMKPRLR
jgi:hypothetical protein